MQVKRSVHQEVLKISFDIIVCIKKLSALCKSTPVTHTKIECCLKFKLIKMIINSSSELFVEPHNTLMFLYAAWMIIEEETQQMGNASYSTAIDI